MALTNEEFLKLADNPDSVDKLDLLIILLDKLVEDYKPLAEAMGKNPDNCLLGHAYLDPNTDYDMVHDEDGEYGEAAVVLEAIQCLPRNCCLRDAIISIEGENADTKVTISYDAVLKLAKHGYQVCVTAEVIEGEFIGLEQDLSPIPMVNVFAGDFVISF